MAYNITLSSSMRSNLLSLRNISTLMNKTQNILSTGKKVNSAIDNATAYYQTRSLTNRASDLNSLLDSMSQGIQTIQAAVTGLDQYGKFLEQAAIVAGDAYEKAVIPTKEWLLSQMGENGVVVSTAQELKDAIEANKETICIYGNINYFENETLTLKANQKIVGTEYFTGYTGKERYSRLNLSGDLLEAIVVNVNNTISDLDLSFTTDNETRSNFIYVKKGSAILNNLDIKHIANKKLTSGASQGVIAITHDSSVSIYGIINIDTLGIKSGFSLNASSSLVINKNAEVNMNIKNSAWGNAILSNKSVIDVYGKLNGFTDKGILLNSGASSGNRINVYNGAEVTLKQNYFRYMSQYDDTTYNSLYFEAGSRLNIKDNSSTKYLLTSSDYQYDNNTSLDVRLSSTDFANSGCFAQVTDRNIDWNTYNPIKEREKFEIPKILAQDMNEYLNMLDQLDDMVEDCSYQGVNLLKGDDLTLVFNESRDHNFVIKGIDMQTISAGITTRTWENKEDISNSTKEIKEAVNKIRQTTEKLGNNLSIIQTRQNFTEALSDILEVGADKLTLADMNETSAEYLMLQTRQQLAVNSLSLASQSAKSILSLF